MMSRNAIFSLFGILSLGTICSAQNLVPNPGFEDRSACPTAVGQFNGYVLNWQGANTATTDYSGCGFTGNSSIGNVPSLGTSSAGIWGGAGHPSCPGTAYAEAVRTNLISPMVFGTPYEVEFRVRVDPQGSSTANSNDCMDFGVYFYNTSSPPPMTGWCCHSVTPQYAVSGSAIPRGPYATFSTNIVAGNWNAVIVGAFCNANTSSCTNYATSRMYFNLDEIMVQELVILNQADFHLQGKAHSDFHAMNWEVPIDHPYQSFTLERSTDGIDFEPIFERLSAPDQTLYQYLDRDPFHGLNHYRLQGVDGNGESYQSEVVTLMRGENGDSQGGVLNYYYDTSADELEFSLDAGEGGPISAELVDLKGRLIQVQTETAATGQQHFNFSVANVAQGMYILRVRALDRDAVWQAKWVR